MKFSVAIESLFRLPFRRKKVPMHQESNVAAGTAPAPLKRECVSELNSALKDYRTLPGKK